MAKVRIHMTGPQTGKVWVDGVELSRVVAVSFATDARDLSAVRGVEITQQFFDEIEIEGSDGAIDVTVLDNPGSRTYKARREQPWWRRFFTSPYPRSGYQPYEPPARSPEPPGAD